MSSYSPQQIQGIMTEAAKPIETALEYSPSELPRLSREGQKAMDNLVGLRDDFLLILDYCQRGPTFYRQEGKLTEEQIRTEFRLVLESAEGNYTTLETEAAKSQAPGIKRYQTETEVIMEQIRDAVSETVPK